MTPIAETRLSCGRVHLRIAGVVLVLEPEIMLCPDEVPVEVHHKDSDSYLRPMFENNWRGASLDWAADYLNSEREAGRWKTEIAEDPLYGKVLRVCGLSLTSTSSPCRDSSVPEEYREKIPEEELSVAVVGGSPAKDLPRDVVRFFRPENWTESGLLWATLTMNSWGTGLD
jgi:hypothetical protein